MSAVYYPDGVDPTLVGRVREQGVVVAGGLHPDAKTKYFRVGHMGVVDASDVVTTVAAIERAFLASGHPLVLGAAVGAAEAELKAR